MSDFSSSNKSYGGLYELGYELEEVTPSYDISNEDEYEEDEIMEHMRIVDEDKIALNLMFTKGEMVISADIVFPEEHRHKLSQYLREAADMLDRKK